MFKNITPCTVVNFPAGSQQAARGARICEMSPWEMQLLCNAVSHWLGTSIKSALSCPGIYFTNNCLLLTHWGWVMYICIGKITIIGSDNGLSPGWHQAIYLNQCWNTVNSNLRNKLQWNLKQNSHIFIEENACENVVCQLAANLSQPQCVNSNSMADSFSVIPFLVITAQHVAVLVTTALLCCHVQIILTLHALS